MIPVRVSRGNGPIILGQPHGGTHVPPGIHARLNDRGRGLSDTDWHITQLYRDLLPEVTTVAATFHRYVIDANRDPAGGSLYPGRNTTGLCPETDFDGHPIWTYGWTPTEPDIAERLGAFHAPYHAILRAEIERVRGLHGVAILFDCHSIRSKIPFLFDGLLPVFNIGTNAGATCAPVLETAVREIAAATGMGHVVNGRFKGGWTTRHYGTPESGVHAIQLELAQRAYMDETPPWTLRPDRAEVVRPVLADMLAALENLAPSLTVPQRRTSR